MKKITLLIITLFFTTNFYSQTYDTGVITLTTGRTVQFEVNTVTDIVTMTMVRPDNSWLGVGPGITTGLGMGNLGDDAIIYSDAGLSDRNMRSGTGEPNVDANQDWMIISNDLNAGVRTLVATRDRDTGESTDFIFPNSATSFSILFAYGSSSTLSYHGNGNYGAQLANLTLSNNIFDQELSFRIYPNPATNNLNIKMEKSFTDGDINIYDAVGRKVFSSIIPNANTINQINLKDWNNGVYLIRLRNSTGEKTQRFIKY